MPIIFNVLASLLRTKITFKQFSWKIYVLCPIDFTEGCLPRSLWNYSLTLLIERQVVRSSSADDRLMGESI